MDAILEKLFESIPKVRLLRLFVRNPELTFEFKEIAHKTKVKNTVLRRELGKLLDTGLIKERAGRRDGKATRTFYLNQDFFILKELRDLIMKDAIPPRKKILAATQKLGRVKLAVLSGVFLNSERSRTDILVVGDNIKKSRLENFLAELESDIGRPLRYTLMDTKEFAYRVDMYDRFLRDILEFPHDKLINKVRI